MEWYFFIIKLIRDIRTKSIDALKQYKDGNEGGAEVLKEYLNTDYSSLYNKWEEFFDIKELGHLGRHLHFGEEHDYEDIIFRDLPKIEEIAEQHFHELIKKQKNIGFENLLHPIIFEHSFQQYKNGHLRDAVLNAIIAVFDFIREKTELNEDGENLVTKALSVQKPYLILSELDTNSGKNDQIGFMQILQGAFRGIRNPKAHSLVTDLDEEKAAQYLIFASLLARRIEESKNVNR